MSNPWKTGSDVETDAQMADRILSRLFCRPTADIAASVKHNVDIAASQTLQTSQHLLRIRDADAESPFMMAVQAGETRDTESTIAALLQEGLAASLDRGPEYTLRGERSTRASTAGGASSSTQQSDSGASQRPLQMTHPSKQSLLSHWDTIQAGIDEQQHSWALWRWERLGLGGGVSKPTVPLARKFKITNMNAQRPTIFVFTSGEQGADGAKIRVATDCCEHFEAKGFEPCVIMGLNLAENDSLKLLLSPWTIHSNRAHLSWFLCFLPKLYRFIESFEDNDAFFICEDSARLLQ